MVSLMDLSKIPIGIALLGLADKNNLNPGLPCPELISMCSSYFSSLPRKVGIK